MATTSQSGNFGRRLGLGRRRAARFTADSTARHCRRSDCWHCDCWHCDCWHCDCWHSDPVSPSRSRSILVAPFLAATRKAQVWTISWDSASPRGPRAQSCEAAPTYLRSKHSPIGSMRATCAALSPADAAGSARPRSESAESTDDLGDFFGRELLREGGDLAHRTPQRALR